MASYRLFASHVAAFLGENRWHSADGVRLEIWHRARPLLFVGCKRKADAKAGRILQTASDIKAGEVKRADVRRAVTASALVQTAAHTLSPVDLPHSVERFLRHDGLLTVFPEAEKRQHVEASREACSEASARSIEEVVQMAAIDPRLVPQVHTILHDNAPVDAANELVRIGAATAEESRDIAGLVAQKTAEVLAARTWVPTIQQSIDVAIRDERQSKVTHAAVNSVLGSDGVIAAQDTHSASRAGIGNSHEGISLDRYAARTQRPVVARQSRYSKSVDCGEGCNLKIIGIIDGLQGGDDVIEAKQRAKRLFHRLIRRDRIQLYTYLYLTGHVKGTLVETYGDEQRAYALYFNADEWSPYLERIRDGIRELHAMLQDPDDTARVALITRALHEARFHLTY